MSSTCSSTPASVCGEFLEEFEPQYTLPSLAAMCAASRANSREVDDLPATTRSATAPPRSTTTVPASYVSRGACGLMFWD
ncbi:hypothetical protein ABPG75_003826 [Micractinium tetrahymenae]